MSWLKFDTATPEKPEVFAITIAMGWDDPDLAVGKLLKVWRWFDLHSVDGNANSVTLALLDRLIGVTGLSQAMVDVGWLEVSDSGLTIPNFGAHNGKTAKDRAETASRVAKHRTKVTESIDEQQCNGKNVTSALAREEKRREEKKEDINTTSESEIHDCPHDELIDLFSKKLPTLSQPRKSLWLKGKNAPALKARWRWVMTECYERGERRGLRMATTKSEGLAWFERFFGYVADSDFLMGRTPKPFNCDFGWLVNAANFEKVVQGNYENKEKSA